MNTTPLWVPLLVAGFGVVGTVVGAISGVLITQRRSDRREKENWARELERERARWSREDDLRTFEQRRAAYVDFYQSLREMGLQVDDHALGRSDVRKLPDGWQQPTFERLQHLQLYGTPELSRLAMDAFKACLDRGLAAPRAVGHMNEFRDMERRAFEWQDALLAAIRKELRVPDSSAEEGSAAH